MMRIWLPFLIAAHVLFWIFWPLAVAVLAVSLVLSVRRNPRHIVPTIALSPFVLVPVVFFGWGVLSYAAGRASLMTYGMPGPEFDNLDRESRCYWSTSGCVVDGSEPFRHAPNNAAVRMMIAMFGPMSGMYRGAYPTKVEVVALLARDARRYSTQEIGGALRAAGFPENGNWGAICTKGAPSDLSWRVVQIQGEAILVATPEEATLFDKATGRVFARYRL